MIAFALSGTPRLALSGTDDSPYQERELPLTYGNIKPNLALNLANKESFGFFLTQAAFGQPVDNVPMAPAS
jgi:hypothetical protein